MKDAYTWSDMFTARKRAAKRAADRVFELCWGRDMERYTCMLASELLDRADRDFREREAIRAAVAAERRRPVSRRVLAENGELLA